MSDKEFKQILALNKFQPHNILTNLYHHPKKQISYCFVIDKDFVLVYRMKYGAINIQDSPKKVLFKNLNASGFGLSVPKVKQNTQPIKKQNKNIVKNDSTGTSEFWDDEEEDLEENN